MGALAVIGYQALVSQSIDPQEPSVLTVGSFQAGNANNVIPDTATLKVNIRWFEPAVREQADRRDQARHRRHRHRRRRAQRPDAAVHHEGQLPARVINDEEAVRRAEPALRLALGEDKAVPGLPTADGLRRFSRPRLAPSHHQDPPRPHRLRPARRRRANQAGQPPAPNHNAKFKVELPTIAAGTKADMMVLLEFLKKYV